MKVEEEYQDVLMNIELTIVGEYREHPELKNYDVEVAVNNAIRAFTAKKRGKPFSTPKMTERRTEIYDRVCTMCEMLLSMSEGEPLSREDGTEVRLPMIDVSLDAMILCLKRIRKSIQHWTKREGPKGYLTFIDDMLP